VRLTRRWHVLDMDVISPAMLAARRVHMVQGAVASGHQACVP